MKTQANLTLSNMVSLAVLILCISMLAQSAIVKADMDWGGAMISTFESLGSDLNDIEGKTRDYSINSWYSTSVMDVGGVGAGACAVPAAGYVTLPAEFMYLMREIYNSSMGLGFLIYGDAFQDDFATILGLWSEEVTLDDETLELIYGAVEMSLDYGIHRLEKYSESLGAAGAGSVGVASTRSVSGKAANEASTKMISKTLAKKTGSKVAGKLGAKVAAKTGAKIGGKYVAKSLTAWIPFISAAVCGGLNMWLMDGVMSAAESYYQKLASFRRNRYK